jgi:hypothetical protein
MDSSIFWDSVLFVVAGIFLMFFIKPWNDFFARLAAQRNPAAAASRAKFVNSPVMLWLFRFIGLISFLFGGLGIWLATGHTIPDFTG